MDIGLNLPQLGGFADPDALRSASVQAEAADFASLWAVDRLLAPVEPRSPYPGSADGSLPADQQRVLDPLLALSAAAAVTERIRIGTDVIVAPWYPPALLARSLATLDQLSGGRLDVGLGLGWSVDEYDAVGVPTSGLGARMEEILAVLSAWWCDDVTAIRTSREYVAPSVVGLKPSQRTGPPILLATFNPAGLDRVARLADGWICVGIPIAVVGAMWSGVLRSAEQAGRDPSTLRLVMRADPVVTPLAVGEDRMPFMGSIAQVAADVDHACEVGVDEVVLDLQSATGSVDELLDTARTIAGDHLVGKQEDRLLARA